MYSGKDGLRFECDVVMTKWLRLCVGISLLALSFTPLILGLVEILG
ncbi:hypothetical protein AAJCM20276_27000 [Acetobacter aceti]|uniref:Uncharacterized protein n=2 Tax=Acetobacter aceti TaxID=435 RepID=A0A6S6PMU4_ACEAC|nr:hypothetical protein AAJCM20276_27000 [Acetobacter aceti]